MSWWGWNTDDDYSINISMKHVFYIDEAWRWPLAWPVYVGVIFQTEHKPKWLSKKLLGIAKDSKVLTENKRDELYKKITSDSFFVSSTWSASAMEIDRLGIIKAQQKAICRGIWKVCIAHFCKQTPTTLSTKAISSFFTLPFPREKYSTKRYSLKSLMEILSEFDELPVIHIDGNHKFWIEELLWIEVIATIRWDSLIPQISMASILAKVERDQFMCKQSKRYPVYGFEKHKWYGTQYHRDMIAKYGMSPIHRTSFVGKGIRLSVL